MATFSNPGVMNPGVHSKGVFGAGGGGGGSIVSLAEMKIFLKIPSSDTSEDDFLTMLINDAQDNVEEYCRRRFAQNEYVEFYSGSGTRAVVLRQRPVQSIVNVWLDNNAYYGQNPSGAFGTDTLLTSGNDYALELDETLRNSQVVSRAGLLIRVKTIWPELNPAYFPGRLTQEYGPAFGNIKVDYIAGYPTAAFPNDLKRAIRLLVAQARQSAQYGTPLSSESISNYSYSLQNISTSQFPEIGTVRQILNRYREVPIGEVTASAPGSYTR